MQIHLDALSKWRRARADEFRSRFAARPQLHIDEWADQYRYLSDKKGNSPEPGPWSTDRVPYLREILRTILDPAYRIVVVLKGAQIAFTEGIVGNVIGYHVHHRPRSMIVVQPSNEDARDWSRDKLDGLIEATPVVQERIERGPERKGREANTVLTKRFAGGQLKIVGGTSPKGLRRTSAPIVLIDEADALPRNVGSKVAQREGSPIDIVLKRMSAFSDGVAVIGSTPTIRGMSVTDEWYAKSDARVHEIPCVHCGHYQVLRWGDQKTPYGMRFEVEEHYGRKQVVRGSTAYECERCHCLIPEVERFRLFARGRWRSTQPEIKGIAGFHIPGFLSPHEASSWEVLAQEWLDAQGKPEEEQVWINTRAGESYELVGERPDPTKLGAIRFGLPDGIEVPAGAALLTAAVDVQKDRLELAVRGWGERLESWLITHQRIHGDTERDDVWERLHGWLFRGYRHESGILLRIQACMIDSGYRKDRVYTFVGPREAHGIYASKGLSTDEPETFLKRSVRRSSEGVRLWGVSTKPLKKILFRRLFTTAEATSPGGPGYYHFCPQTDTGADAEYFHQFGAEKFVKVRRGGRIVTEIVQDRDRNEAIDLEVGNLAALYSLGRATREQLGEMARKLAEAGRRGDAVTVGQMRRKRRVRSKGIRG